MQGLDQASGHFSRVWFAYCHVKCFHVIADSFVKASLQQTGPPLILIHRMGGPFLRDPASPVIIAYVLESWSTWDTLLLATMVPGVEPDTSIA